MSDGDDRRRERLGWHYDEDTGTLMRDVIHRMGRRCHNWDYRGLGTYLITLTLADRASHALGRLCHDAQKGAFVELSAVGRLVGATMTELPRQWPGVEVLGLQVMPDHLHAVIAVRARPRKPLGAIVGSFKSKATSRWLKLGRARPSAKDTESNFATGNESLSAVTAEPGFTTPIKALGDDGRSRGAAARAPASLFAEGFVDTILFDAAAVAHARAYLADNPRRLWEKRAHPELFAVLRDLPVSLGAGLVGHFAAIGNHNLLKAHAILQVQCSRRFFAYARDADGRLLKDAPPRVETDEFRESCEALLEEAAHGAVLVSPCISEGEREIARRAFVAGFRVITLANKGFSPLYKPGGKLFDTCAAGNLLMLAPINWPYLPGEKKMTRADACVLNRLAQWIAGSGAVEVSYKGIQRTDIDQLAQNAVGAERKHAIGTVPIDEKLLITSAESCPASHEENVRLAYTAHP